MLLISKIKPFLGFAAPTLFFLLLVNFVVLNATVPSCSMQSTLNPGDRMICIRQPLCGSVARGDVIVFKAPVTNELYVKRVIGMPGETVSIEKGKIYVNGSKSPLEEDYLYEEWTVANDRFKVTVPKDSYFVLGDNRNDSNDGRFWAIEAEEKGLDNPESYTFVSKESLVAEAWVKYYPGFCFIE